MNKIFEKKGLTFIELLVVLALLAVLVAASVPVLHLFQKKNALQGDAEKVLSILEAAQNKTLASTGPGQYGVYFDQSSARYILFKGASYGSRDPSLDFSYNFSPEVALSEVNLDNSQVVFERISGSASQTGTVVIFLKDDLSQKKTIYIQNSGAASLKPLLSPSDSDRAKDSRHVHIDYSRVIDTSTETIELDFNGTAKSIPIASNVDDDGQMFWEGEIEADGSDQKIKIHTHRLNSPDTQFCIHRDRRYNDVAVVINLSGDTSGSLAEYSQDGLSTNHTSIYVTDFSWQ